MTKSVNLIIRINSIEPTDDNETAVEMALDRLGGQHVVALLQDAGFAVALPIDYEVLSVDVDQLSLLDSDERFDLDGEDRWVYVPTHRSRSDGSDAMLIMASKNGQNCLFANENGDEWQDSINEWEPIA